MRKSLIACALLALCATPAAAADADKAPDPKQAQIDQLARDLAKTRAQLNDAMTAVRVLVEQRDDAVKSAQDAELKRWLAVSHAAPTPTDLAPAAPQHANALGRR